MNFLEEVKRLDAKDVGRWPLLFRGIAIGLIFVVLTAVFVYFVPMSNQMPVLEKARQDEADLMKTFKATYLICP